jgi:epoxide hydrolase-like predicted phosphatase
MSIRAVIFDIGGVLLHKVAEQQGEQGEYRPGLSERELIRTVEKLGLAQAATCGKMTEHQLWQRTSEYLELTEAEIDRIKASYRPVERLNTELVTYLQSLRPRYKTALLSNAWPGTREALAQKFGMDTITDELLFSYEVGWSKPDARIYQLILLRLRVEANEAIFVDDKPANVDAAELLGMQGVVFHDTAQTIVAIQKRLHHPR